MEKACTSFLDNTKAANPTRAFISKNLLLNCSILDADMNHRSLTSFNALCGSCSSKPSNSLLLERWSVSAFHKLKVDERRL